MAWYNDTTTFGRDVEKRRGFGSRFAGVCYSRFILWEPDVPDMRTWSLTFWRVHLELTFGTLAGFFVAAYPYTLRYRRIEGFAFRRAWR